MAEITFQGETFTLPEKVGLMPLMRFAKVAKGGADTDDLDGLVAIYDLLRQCFLAEDWARFEKLADEARCDGEELLAVTQQVIQALSERPTSRPSDSSGGPTTIEPKSGGDSSRRVIERLEAQGRPDLALMVVKTQESLAG